MRKNMTIKEMGKETRINLNKANNLGWNLIKEVPGLKPELTAALNYSYGHVKKFAESAQENYIRKDDMKKILEDSRNFVRYLENYTKALHQVKRELQPQ